METKYGVIAKYHDQPPIDTPAREWSAAWSVSEYATVSELMDWADKNGGLQYLVSLEITNNGRRA